MTNKSGIDQGALIEMFSQASARQGEALRQAVSTATLKALQGRELTLQNVRNVLQAVTQAASAGAAQNPGSTADVQKLLEKAFDGMDRALLKAVEAHRTALQQFVSQGADLQQGPLKTALTNLEKMEEVFFSTVGKAVQDSAGPVQNAWAPVLNAMKLKGTDTGAQATATVEQLLNQAHSTLRDSRAMGLRTAQALLEGYSTLVSGVLIGMTEGLQQGSAEAPATGTRKC
jgi:flagellar hook-basal body complex protein FliE